MATQQPHDNEQQHDDYYGSIFINLQVPPDAEAGVDSLTFEYCGSEFDVLVPAGSLPGDVLRIQVANSGVSDKCDATNSNLAAEADGNDDEDNAPNDVSEEIKGNRPTPTSFINETNKRTSLLSKLSGLARNENDIMMTKRLKGESDDADGKPGENITIVPLGDGIIQGKDAITSISLHLFESTEKLSDNIEDVNIIPVVGDGTHGMVWASGTVLAQALTSAIGIEFLAELLSRWDDSLPRRHIYCLELGSGLGVCGLALAHAIHKLHCNAEHEPEDRTSILLTDYGGTALQLLSKNIQKNLPRSFRGQSAAGADDGKIMNIIAAESLVWGDSLQSTAVLPIDDKIRFHLILGSDILYSTHASYDPLVDTIQQYLHPSGGTILLAVRWRKPELEREFFRMVEDRIKGMKFQLWKEFVDDKDFGGRRCPCVLTWEDYGNPESELSNCHFHETTIWINNKQAVPNGVPLSNVTERDMELMTDDEYSKFEELQVQIYVGRYDVHVRPTKKVNVGDLS